MVSVADNARLTEVDRGTPMGELLRHYWHPVAALSELDEERTKAVRLLGQDLVLYRDRSGNLGLLDRHCPHRRADLSYGYVEECGLRCSYHGWLFDEQGHCIGQPFEELTPGSRFREQISAGSYLVEEKAGILFAYLGPRPAPLLPNWELFGFEDGFCQIVFSEVPCNWLQCQENSIDPVHFEWLHSNWSNVLTGRKKGPSPTHLRIDFEEFEFGFSYRRMLSGETEEGRNWSWPRLCILPNLFQPLNHFEWRVPIDRERTLSVVWQYTRVPADREPFRQEKVPFWYAPVTDPLTGRLLNTHVMNQDITAWSGQGTVADRENEHLGTSDLGVRMLRRQLEADMDAVARGEDPKGLVRDPAANRSIVLPRRAELARRITREEWLADFRAFSRNAVGDYFSLLAGQPEAVRSAFEEAMGISPATVEAALIPG